VYDSFPSPEHTNESYVQLNFLNDRGVDFNGNNLTVWITVIITADEVMQGDDPRFRSSYQYVYLDAYPLARGERLFFTIPYNLTGAGRLSAGRVHIYYRDPALFDTAKQGYPGGKYPLQNTTITPITNSLGQPIGVSQEYQALIEFSVDYVRGGDRFNQSFIGYDYSAVDGFALPIYVYGGNDPRVADTLANRLSCKKAYVACQTPQAIEEGCPTQIEQNTTSGSTCISSFIYCAKNPSTPETSGIRNLTHWLDYCQRFDGIAAQFNITSATLAFYRACKAQVPRNPACPPNNLIFYTPTAVVYGCVGQFLLENHCKEDGSRNTGSHLTTDQCSALNRGVCFNPDTSIIPPTGLSCALSNCGVDETYCYIPCSNYSQCFGFQCLPYTSGPNFDVQCGDQQCSLGGGNLATGTCKTTFDPIPQVVDAGCNSTTPNPYTFANQTKNEYAAWVRSKGSFLYGFSLDERGPGGAFQQCSFSTQLDVVIYPACNDTTTI
jgi:hypothetical protein